MRFLIPVVFALMLFTGTAMAAPQIQQFVLQEDLWLGEYQDITARCMDVLPISRVYVDITGPGIILPSLDLVGAGDNMYTLSAPATYFDRTGDFTAVLHCQANGTSNSTQYFTISDLTGDVTIKETPFVGDVVEFAVDVKKNGVSVITDISFDVSVDSSGVDLIIPPIYDVQKGWILKIDAPSAGAHQIDIDVSHSGRSLVIETPLEVNQLTDFQIKSIDKQNIRSDDNITIDLNAMHHGSLIQVSEDNLQVTIDSEEAEILGITQSGDLIRVKISAPELSAGSYDLEAEILFEGTYYSDTEEVNYLSELNGRLTDSTGKGMNAKIRFYQGSKEKYTVSTNSDGTYSHGIVPGVYVIQVELPEALLSLEDVEVDEFDEPFDYTYYSSVSVPGFLTSGVHVLESDWQFDRAVVKFRYEDIFDEPVEVYKCNQWNKKKKSCDNDWDMIVPDIDDSWVIFSVSSFSAFAVGIEDEINVRLETDKEFYSLKDIIRLSGTATGQRSRVTNATVSLKILELNENYQLNSGSNGQLSLEFRGPDRPGIYTIDVTAERYPYLPYTGSYTLNITALPGMSVLFPGSVKVMQGTNKTETIKIVNTGQTDLTNIDIAIDLEDRFYDLGSYAYTIQNGGEINVPILFTADAYEDETTHSAKITVRSDEIEREKIIGFTVTEKVDTVVTGAVTENPIEFDVDMNIVYILVVAAVAFSGAFFLKRYRGNKMNNIPLHNPVNMPMHPSNQGIRYNQPYTQSKTSNDRNQMLFYLTDVKNYLRRGGNG